MVCRYSWGYLGLDSRFTQPAPTVYDPSRVVVQMTTPSPEEPNG